MWFHEKDKASVFQLVSKPFMHGHILYISPSLCLTYTNTSIPFSIFPPQYNRRPSHSSLNPCLVVSLSKSVWNQGITALTNRLTKLKVFSCCGELYINGKYKYSVGPVCRLDYTHNHCCVELLTLTQIS